MPFALADCAGMSWMTSQCSTTLPSSTRKMSTIARPGVASPRVDAQVPRRCREVLAVDGRVVKLSGDAFVVLELRRLRGGG
jgi:hypothetical protein